VTAAYVIVQADGHPERDEDVDEMARRAPPGGLVDIGAETYRGLWRLPTPERTVVHLYAIETDVPAILGLGLEPINGPRLVGLAPPWAHRLLDAFLTGEPLNFGGELPPPDIRERLDRAAADGTLGKVRA
jgi:hypothetical protein